MKAEEYSSLALAYIGDAHYAKTVKRWVIDCEAKMYRMQKHTNRYVSARAQAEIIDSMLDFDLLTEKEIEVYKRGRNSKAHKAPKNTDPVTYHKSTGFEALWGYLYVSGQMERLEQLWDYIRTLKEK